MAAFSGSAFFPANCFSASTLPFRSSSRAILIPLSSCLSFSILSLASVVRVLSVASRASVTARRFSRRHGGQGGGLVGPLYLQLRLGKGQVAVAYDLDQDLGPADLPRCGLHDGQGRPAVVVEKLVAGAVLLAHRTIQLLAPLSIEFAKLAVLVTGRFTFLVLLPEQYEGEMLVATQFIIQGLASRAGATCEMSVVAAGDREVSQEPRHSRQSASKGLRQWPWRSYHSRCTCR